MARWPRADAVVERCATTAVVPANAGDDDAAYSYGVMLRDGKGAPQDIAEAVRWLKHAADDGIIAGQVEYGITVMLNQIYNPKEGGP